MLLNKASKVLLDTLFNAGLVRAGMELELMLLVVPGGTSAAPWTLGVCVIGVTVFAAILLDALVAPAPVVTSVGSAVMYEWPPLAMSKRLSL